MDLITELRSGIDAASAEIDRLRAERDYYRDMSTRLMEIVERQGLSYAESVQVESVERRLDEYAEGLPA